jgi:hypothetical protein
VGARGVGVSVPFTRAPVSSRRIVCAGRPRPAGRIYAARRHGRERREMGKTGRSTGSVVAELMRLRCLSDRPFIPLEKAGSHAALHVGRLALKGRSSSD